MLSNIENIPPLLVRLFVQFFVNMLGSWKGSFSFIGFSAGKRKDKNEKAQPQESGKKLREGLIDRSSPPFHPGCMDSDPRGSPNRGWAGMGRYLGGVISEWVSILNVYIHTITYNYIVLYITITLRRRAVWSFSFFLKKGNRRDEMRDWEERVRALDEDVNLYWKSLKKKELWERVRKKKKEKKRIKKKWINK